MFFILLKVFLIAGMPSSKQPNLIERSTKSLRFSASGCSLKISNAFCWSSCGLFLSEQIDPESDSDEEAENIGKDVRKTKNLNNDKLMNSKNVTLSSIGDEKKGL